MPTLVQADWLMILLSLFCFLAIGLAFRSNVKSSRDFFQAGRALPTWVCTLAFVAAGVGFQDVIGMGAAGARYGFKAALFFSLGAIPAMLFAGVFMMPLYYGSGARTVPEYLGLRFDRKTRLLNAGTFLVISVASAGITLYLMARLLQALRIFDPLFYAYGWPREGIFAFCVLLFAVVVLIYVLLAGLAGAMINQALQFAIVVAAFLPVVLMGLKHVDGWSLMKGALPAAYPHSGPMLASMPAMLLWIVLGFVLGAGRWTTDFRILQSAMAAKSVKSARRIPLFAAATRLLLPFVLILPGAIAIILPTPQSTTVVRNENGVIYHEITVVPPETAAGRGLVPARVDAATGHTEFDAAGQAVLDYDRTTPAMLEHFLSKGVLGLGIAALLASLMSGLAASVTAANAVFTLDLYQSCIRKNAGDGHYLAVGRWAAVGAVLLSAGAAFACAGAHIDFSNILYPLLMGFSLVSAPQLATFLLGMFTKRTTGHGAFAGLVAGTAAGLLHYGLTLPADAQRGLYGGWIAVAHRYSGFIAQCAWTAAFAFGVNVVVAIAVSWNTKARTQAELKGLVHSARSRTRLAAGPKRPEAMAIAILIAAAVLALLLV